jgi:hypothetical protein
MLGITELVQLVTSLASRKDTTATAREWILKSIATAASSGSEQIQIRHHVDEEMIGIRFSQPQQSSADLSIDEVKNKPVLPPHCPQMKGLPGGEFKAIEQVLMEFAGVTGPYTPWGNRPVSSRDAEDHPVQSFSFKTDTVAGEVLHVTVHTSQEKGLRRIDLHINNRGAPFKEN